MKYTFAIILLLLSFFSYSQKIDGIGKFKIDKTNISIISDIEDEIKTDCGITNELDFYSNKDSFIFKKIILDYSDIKLFYLTEYTVLNIKLMNIYFMFYKDYLIQFRCDRNDELDKMLSRKYGRPFIEQKTTMNIKNLDLVYDEYISKYTWSNKNILAISFEKKTKI